LAEPAQSADVEIRYAGGVFVLELATIAKLVRPGGVRVVVAESLLIKH
jgi:hypothetical protein